MHAITCVLLDEDETATLTRILPLVPLAYPTSDQPPHLRPADVRPVDVRDPRVRILPHLTARPFQPLTYPQVVLAHEVTTHLVEVLAGQSETGWWLDLLEGRTVRDEDVTMAVTMAAERGGQLSRVEAAAGVIASALAALTPADDPAHWDTRTDEVGEVAEAD